MRWPPRAEGSGGGEGEEGVEEAGEGRGAEADEGADGEEKGLGGVGGGHALFSRLLLPENAFGDLPDSTGIGFVEP